MATTQYIGARYVPLVCGEWDSSKTYEPLSIVMNGGDSYTSLQNVPAGIDLFNENYWVCTANYNAQIETYRQEVRSQSARVTANAAAIAAETTAREAADAAIGEDIAAEATARDAAIAAEATARDAAISVESATREDADEALNALIDTEEAARKAADTVLSGRITSIETAGTTAKYKGHRMLVIGDSYAYGTGASDHGTTEQKRFSTRLASMLDSIEVNYAVGSTGFCDPGSAGQNMTFNDQVIAAAAAMDDTEREDVRLIVIAGGINDEREGTTYSGAQMIAAATTVCQTAASYFTNADIKVFPMLWCGYQWTYHAFNFCQRIIEGVMLSGCASAVQGCWSWNFGKANNIGSDNLHPTDAGHEEIANRMFETISNGAITNYADQLFTLGSIEGGSQANRTYGIFQNGVINFGNMICGTSGKTYSGNTNIGTLPNGMCPENTLYAPMFKSNAFAGTCAITPTGNLYVNPTSAISGPFYVGTIAYIPYGKQLH